MYDSPKIRAYLQVYLGFKYLATINTRKLQCRMYTPIVRDQALLVITDEATKITLELLLKDASSAMNFLSHKGRYDSIAIC